MFVNLKKTGHILDRSTSTWNEKTWVGGPGTFYGEDVWTDGDNIYYSSAVNQTQYVLVKP